MAYEMEQASDMGPEMEESPEVEAAEYGQGDVMSALNKALYSVNLAEEMDEDELLKMGQFVKTGYDADKASREDWEKDYESSLKQAMQVAEPRSWPWKGASNIKFPIIAIAAMQFSARAYPTLVPPDRMVVRQKVIGYDPQGAKAASAEALGMFMSWQLMDQMKRWEEDMDRLLLSLPIIGTVFKKTYWDTASNRPCSEMVHAIDLVVNYWASDLESAERKTQEYRYTKRQLEEMFRGKIFREIELGNPNTTVLKTEDKLTNTKAPPADGADTPYLVLEQHTFYDVDGDDYPEPVVITVMGDTGEVLRVTARWEADGVKVNDEGDLVRIEPCEYYTKFGMFPNPDGGFYDVGFGRILGSLNDAVDSIINQLVDAGTLANLQGGWMSKGLKIKQGSDAPFKPGEWRQVNATLDDIKKGLAPHQYKEPSNVLFQLLGMLVGVSKELASVAEIMTGKMPGQNTPAYTTKEATEQGMKVFTAVYKRVFRSLTAEFRKLHRLNKLYVTPEDIQRVLDAPQPVNHVQIPDDDIVPAADPQAVSAATKSAKARQFMELIQMNAINRQAALKKILEYEEVPLTPELLAPPEPQPDPKAQAEQARLQGEMEMMKQEHELKMKEMQMELQFKQQELELEKQKAQLELQLAEAKLEVEMKKLGMSVQKAQVDSQVKMQQSHMDMQQSQMDHSLNMEQSQEAHKMKLTQMKEAASAKAKQGGNSGVASKPNNSGNSGKNR